MGLIARVLSFTRLTRNEAKVSDVKLDPGGGANLTAEHFAPIGDDSHPLPGDYAVTAAVPGAGREAVVGYIDPKNTPTAAAGEKRIYSRDSNGAAKAEVWLKADGTIVATNGGGSFELQAGGSIVLNGVTIDPSGNISGAGTLETTGDITSDGEVTAGNAVPAAAVKLTSHVHPTAALGPPSSPTPGT